MLIVYLQLVEGVRVLRVYCQLDCKKDGKSRQEAHDGTCKAIAFGYIFGGTILMLGILLLTLYICGKVHNMSLGETFGRLRDAFRDSKPSLN
ncbi:hypothetical protein BBBOND_0305410 [Babesia bigemina]|uniref:Uncharacterized protein n=1 Tax=Babesia bigemina TaxID=5866 RepID=A0A061D7W4_BABBI|nr:hypothetical protein BBBOND_0305410 [Babesia bigemina]CDR96638.1 hypothetical protein BBBOND_0305410 [Babesia bigemina]|eukprot:XP_012768824.1 hypothetical protein BBBOND_0305410 [Babesia bigemina]